jgi:glycine cleavage system regulatory protein
MRSTRVAFALAAGCLVLVSCGNQSRNAGNARSGVDFDVPVTNAPAAAPMPMMAEKAASDIAVGSPARQQIVNPQAQGQVAQQIAYTYEYTFAVPSPRMQELMDAQKAACQQAGPAKCYILSSSISGIGEDSASGQMQIKASADWIKDFQSALPNSLKGLGAKIDSTTTQAEDLTTQIIDITARLNSNKTLRDRLQALLKDRPGKLGDLLDIERELARVQGEIDATESVLAAMKLRVAMSTLTLSYRGEYSAVSESIWRPLGDAFKAILPNIVGSLAWIVEAVSSLLIWIVLLGGVVAFAWKPWRRRGKIARTMPVAPPGPKTG